MHNDLNGVSLSLNVALKKIANKLNCGENETKIYQ